MGKGTSRVQRGEEVLCHLDKTRLMHLYLLKSKDKTEKVYKQYEAWVETQMGIKIKVLHSDQGGEYQGDDFAEYLKSKGTH